MSSILCKCQNQRNLFTLIVFLLVFFFLINNIKVSMNEAALLVVRTSSRPSRKLSVWGLSYNLPTLSCTSRSSTHSFFGNLATEISSLPLIVLMRATCPAHFMFLQRTTKIFAEYHILSIYSSRSFLHLLFPSFFSASNSLFGNVVSMGGFFRAIDQDSQKHDTTEKSLTYISQSVT